MYAKGKAAPVPSDSQAREKSDGRRTSPWVNHQDFCTPGGVYFGTCTALHQNGERRVTIPAKPRLSMTTLLQPQGTMAKWMQADNIHQGPPGSQMSPHGHPPPSHTPNAPPMMGHHGQPFMPSRYPGGPRPHPRMATQAPGGMPGPQPLLHNTMDPRNPGHPVIAGPLQRMSVPRGLVPIGPQGYAGGLRPVLPNALGTPPIPAMSMGPGGRSWPNPTSIPYSASSPGNYGMVQSFATLQDFKQALHHHVMSSSMPNHNVTYPHEPYPTQPSYLQAPPGSGPPGTPIMPSPGDSNSSDMYSMMNPAIPGNRPSFQMGPGGEGPMAGLSGMAGMEPHPMNGSLGSGEMDGIPKNSPPNLSSLSNAPGTPHDDGEIPAGFLNAFPSDGDQNESAAILKIKESMQEEAKRFEKEPGDHPDFTYMQ